MKKTFLIVMLLLFSATLLVAKESYTIKGKIQKNDGTALLVQLRGNKVVVLDSAKIVNNSFTFKGTCQPVVNSAAIAISGMMGQIPVFLEKGAIEIDVNKDALYKSRIKGGKYSETLSRFYNEDSELYDLSMFYLGEHHRTRQLNLPDSAKYYSEQFKLTEEKIKTLAANFRKNNQGNALGLFYLRAKLMARTGYEELKSEFAKYDETQFSENYDYKILKEYLNALLKNSVGAVMEDITLPDKEGKIVQLSSLRGKYVLIDFWASWCGPCRREAKHLVEVYKSYEGKPFEILAVSIDADKERWMKAMAEDKTPWIHLWDAKSQYKEKFAILAIPRLMLIDPEGKIINSDITGEELEQKLKEYFIK